MAGGVKHRELTSRSFHPLSVNGTLLLTLIGFTGSSNRTHKLAHRSKRFYGQFLLLNVLPTHDYKPKYDLRITLQSPYGENQNFMHTSLPPSRVNPSRL